LLWSSRSRRSSKRTTTPLSLLSLAPVGVGVGWIDQLVAWPLLRQRPFPAVLFA
jgi:hypothetical protein